MAEWEPPRYMWLMLTTTDSGLQFFDIYTTRDRAKERADSTSDVELLWVEDASGG